MVSREKHSGRLRHVLEMSSSRSSRDPGSERDPRWLLSLVFAVTCPRPTGTSSSGKLKQQSEPFLMRPWDDVPKGTERAGKECDLSGRLCCGDEVSRFLGAALPREQVGAGGNQTRQGPWKRLPSCFPLFLHVLPQRARVCPGKSDGWG